MHLSLLALDLGPGDEVITTPFTFCSTAHVIEHVGARPIFADVDPVSMQIDPNEVERRITSRTKAILPVHYGGHPCEIETIADIASSRRLSVVEDAAHAVGAAVRERPIGSISTLTCFSFYATKNITTGEGGMVTTNDAALSERLQRLRLHGISRDAWKRYRQGGSWYYEVAEPGFKANLTDFQAALGLSQLTKEPRMRARRKEIAQSYSAAFTKIADLVEIVVPSDSVRPAWHLYPLRLHLEALTIDRATFITELEARNIGTSVHFIPLHLQPHFQSAYGHSLGDFPNSEAAYERIISLPIYPDMTHDDVGYVIDSVTDIATASAR